MLFVPRYKADFLETKKVFRERGTVTTNHSDPSIKAHEIIRLERKATMSTLIDQLLGNLTLLFNATKYPHF